VIPLLDGYRCIAMDLPGHAGSIDAPADGSSLAAITRPVIDAVTELGLDRFVAVGLSFGGSVSVRLGLDVPERVESVMAFMPWNAGGTEPGDPFMAQLHDSWADPDAVRHVVEFISLDPARTTDVQQTMTGAVSEAFWRRWYGAGVFTSMLDELPGMTVPVCYVLGGRDTVAPRDALIGDVLAMPGGRLVLLAEAGHLAPYEHPELVATEVREFVGRVAARPVEA
jgi:Predicted hydrolases or acyltransferases (alpha/beta hydrolase superfamily)